MWADGLADVCNITLNFVARGNVVRRRSAFYAEKRVYSEPLGRRERPIARRAARGGAAREPQRDARPDRGTRRPAGAARTKSRVDGCVPPLPSTGTAKGANQTRHTESGVRPRCGSRMKRPGTGDRHASTIVASCGRPNHGLSARSIGPGFVARSPEPRFIAARAGASRRTRRGSAIVRHRAAAGCRPSTRRESRRSPIVSLHPKAREPSLRHARRRCIATGAAIVSVL